MKKFRIKSLPKAQVGIEKEQYLDPAYVYPTEKKRKKFGDLMDQVKAFGNTFAGRIVDKENLYPDRSMQSLQQYIQDVKEYQKQAAEYQKARRLVKQKKMSTDSFADRYESNNWARFDKNVRRNTAEEQAELVDTWYGGINPIHVAEVAKVVAGTAPLAPFVLPVAAPVLTSALTNPLVQAGLTGYGVYDATTNSIPEAYKDFSEGRYLEGIGNTVMATLDLAPIPLFGTNLIDEAVDAAKYSKDLINKGKDLGKYTKQLGKEFDALIPGSPNAGKGFKSEIDWAKWNKEIPENKALMDEYLAIEQKAKADGTWMKNPDGSKFKGTPEQFVQQNSQNFKKAFPQGADRTYRGVKNNNPELQTSDNVSGTGIYTGDRSMAEDYVYRNKETIKNQDPAKDFNSRGGIFDLYSKKTDNFIEFDAGNQIWNELNLNSVGSKAQAKFNIEKMRERLEFLKTQDDFPQELLEQQQRSLEYWEKRLAQGNFDVKNEEAFKQMWESLGNKTTTDDIAAYMDRAGLDRVKINNIVDGVHGDEIIHNHRLGNYLKSAVGNNGMFDMTNPNVFKTLVPAAGAAGAIGLMGSQTESKEPFSTFRPNYQAGGSIELELSPEEIQWYTDNGYVVEEINEYQDGGDVISSYGWDYKKEGDQYFTRKTGTSQWITPTGNALTAIKQKVFNELPYTAADRRADYLKNLETLVNQGYTIDDLVNMGMGTKAGLTSILGTTETATPQVSETVDPVQQKSYWDPYNYGNKYTMTGIEQPSFNLDMSSVNNFALSKEPENVAYAKELRKEGKALTPEEQQAFDITYDPYQMAANRFTMPKTQYAQEVFTAREKLPVSNYWNPMFATYAEAMGQLFNPEAPEYTNQQSTLDRVFEVAKMFGNKESIIPQEQSLPINYDPRMSAQKDAEYRAARNFWDNKTKDLEDASALFDRETLYSVQDYKKNWPSYAKRYLTKKGYLKPDAVETDYEDTKQKIEEKPRVDTFFEKLESSKDKHYQNTTGTKLMKFRHQWDGNEGFTYYVTKSKGLDRNPSETYENVEGVGHFALDANPLKGSTNIHRNNFTYVRNNILNDEYIPIYKQSLEKNKINMSYKKPSEMTPEEVKALDIFKKYDEKFKKATSARMKNQVAKEYAEEIDDNDIKIVEPLRQVAFDNIDFNSGKKAPTFKSAKYIQTKDGKETKLLYTNPSKKAYGRFDGAGVSFIFKDKYGNTIVRDFAGSIVDIQEEGKNIKKQYNLKDGELVVGYHDVGSFSAKPVAQDGKLRISDFDTYNDSPGTGTALIIPSSPQIPLLNEFYK